MKTMYKKLSVTLLLSVGFFFADAQSVERQGYIGIGIGPSFLMGYTLADEKAKTGLNITLLDFGYVFAKGFGVSASWVGGAHNFNPGIISITINNVNLTGKISGTVSYGALMVGPLYSLKLTDKSFINIKARCGMFYSKESMSMNLFESESEKSSLGYSVTISYQLKIAKRWCVMLTADYYSGTLESISSSNDRLNVLALNAGVGFLIHKI